MRLLAALLLATVGLGCTDRDAEVTPQSTPAPAVLAGEQAGPVVSIADDGTPQFGPTPTRTKVPFVPPTPVPTPWWIVTPTPTVTRTPGPTAVPTPAATPVVTPVADHTPVPTPAATPIPGAPIVLVLRWPQRGLVVYEAGMAKRASDGQPWVIPFDTPEHGVVNLVLVTPEMVNKQYARAEAAANKAMDAVAGAYSLLSEVKKRQPALAQPKKKER